jgi:hypothetical protein
MPSVRWRKWRRNRIRRRDHRYVDSEGLESRSKKFESDFVNVTVVAQGMEEIRGEGGHATEFRKDRKFARCDKTTNSGERWQISEVTKFRRMRNFIKVRSYEMPGRHGPYRIPKFCKEQGWGRSRESHGGSFGRPSVKSSENPRIEELRTTIKQNNCHTCGFTRVKTRIFESIFRTAPLQQKQLFSAQVCHAAILPCIYHDRIREFTTTISGLIAAIFPWVCSKYDLIFCRDIIHMFTATFAAYITASLAINISANWIWKFITSIYALVAAPIAV